MTTLNTSQKAAIEAVIRQFAQQAIDHGVPPWQRDPCPACARPQPKAGFVTYPDGRICNDCALDYEIALAERRINSLPAFLDHGRSRRKAKPQPTPAA